MSLCWRMLTTLTLTVAAALAVLAEESQVLRYTSDNFKLNIREFHGNFIMFSAPWCSHCTVFQPIWDQLGEMVNTPGSKFAIAQVDCTVESNLCRDNDITGYPTLLYYKQNSFQPSEYRGTRDLPALTLFLNEVMTANNDIYNENTPDAVKIHKGMAYLTDANFDKFASSGQHFIMFYAPWCGVSQSLAPTWAALAEQYESNTSVQIGKIDCMEHIATCINFDFRDYPHLVWMLNGKVMEDVSGSHSLEDLRDLVERMARPENHHPDRYMRRKRVMLVANISEDTFDAYMKKDLVFINYYAAWCAHCKLMVPTWLELGRTLQADSRVIVGDVDCSHEETLCAQEDIHHFPTLVLYKNSKVIFQHRGSTTLENLMQELDKHLEQLSDVSGKVKDEL